MYYDLKIALTELLLLSKDALHVHVGLAIFFGMALVLRRSPGSALPWLAALAAAVGNEVLDLRWSFLLVGYWLESGKDIVNTMLWPTILALWFRRCSRAPEALAEHRRRRPSSQSDNR